MNYCDTSLLVAALVPEAQSKAADLWLRQQATGELCISTWTITEFSAAIALKVRHGTLPADLKSDVLTAWRSMQLDQLVTVPVTEEAFKLAARFCDMKNSTLRAGDALHLAAASLGGHGLATLDERMKEAAEAVGVKVVGV